ncbi:hypothetical protein M408DRAFT_150232 [Serendipita vermifera MAFF 305830]|uniref:C2H2-type domain-containing protein n=1 Tax=Serendipita vermifera MAFF 305830 TaxID=933852 RepID=A0A0C2XWD3_SERVB|nr:hypothetical protein M408DRAFT_150232 [Serendipita vermifera MAFF 305830]
MGNLSNSMPLLLQTTLSPFASDNAIAMEENRIFKLVSELLEYSRRIPAVSNLLDKILLPEANDAPLRSILESIATGDGEFTPDVPGLDDAIAKVLATLTEQIFHLHPKGPALVTNPRKRSREDFEAENEPEADVGVVIHAALKALQNNIIDPALLTTLQLRLHAIFVTSVSSLTPLTPPRIRDTLGKLITSEEQIPSAIPNTEAGRATRQVATHPCPYPTCLKIFSKAYDLRIHSRVHANHRPFACPTCPATFTRKHDLQRHVRAHPSLDSPQSSTDHEVIAAKSVPMVRCTVCSQTFSRRDAFLRHTRGSRGKKQTGTQYECATALGETVLNLPASARKGTGRKASSSYSDPRHESPRTETAETHEQPDPGDPFSIFSEMDFTQMGVDLGQLLGLTQITDHVPEIE